MSGDTAAPGAAALRPFAWSPASAPTGPIPRAPLSPPAGHGDILPGRVLWDHWPVQDAGGGIAEVDGGQLGIFLSAPRAEDPDARHALSRLRLMHRRGGLWHDLGLLLPDGLSPGSREWAGSARLSADGGLLTLYFTAAGVAAEAVPTFGQRMLETRARLVAGPEGVRLEDWSVPTEIVRPDGRLYASEMAGGGAIGTIKAFRDPAWFRDPADGRLHMLFCASLGQSADPFNGAVGLATQEGDGWALRPPLLTADGVNNELERPHIVAHGGLLYLFWSTQAKVFAPGLGWPTGLYGAVAERLTGPWRLLNGDGLLFANPAGVPDQAYSWLVNADLSVWSFLDMVGAPPRFAGVPAPVLRLALSGDRARLLA